MDGGREGGSPSETGRQGGSLRESLRAREPPSHGARVEGLSPSDSEPPGGVGHQVTKCQPDSE